MPERGKGKGRGRKRKAAAAADVNPVEPENYKTDQPGSPMPTQTQSQRYVPRFTIKKCKRSRVSSSEAVPVALSQTLETVEDAHEPRKENFLKSSIPEAELQAVEQEQQTVRAIHDAALHQLGGVCQVESRAHLDGVSRETSDNCGGFESSACGSSSFIPGLALSQSNVSTSPEPRCHHSISDVIPSGQGGLKADNETTNELHVCENETDQQDCNEQISLTPAQQTGSPPVKFAVGQDGKNLELLDLMASDDDTENEGIGCIPTVAFSMEKATVEVGKPLCVNVDVPQEEAGKTTGGTFSRVESDKIQRQTDFHVIDITSRGSVGDGAVPAPGELSDTSTLQVVSSGPDAVLPSSQDHNLAQGAQESFYDGDSCGSQKKNSSVTDEKTSAGLPPRDLNGSQLSASFENPTFSQQNEVPSIVNSNTAGTAVSESYNTSLLSLAPLPTKDASSATTAVPEALSIETRKLSSPCDTKIGVTMETTKAEWEESEANVAVRELMDIAAADLLESQLGCSGDEATVPSCSPASKQQPTSKPHLGHAPPLWLQRAGDVTNAAAGSGASGGVQNSSETVPGKGTGILCGLIEELSALNRFIMNCKWELNSARKQRSSWLKSQRGRRGR